MPGSRYPESTIKSFFLFLETPVPTAPLPRAVDGSCADRVSRRNAGGGAREMMKAHTSRPSQFAHGQSFLQPADLGGRRRGAALGQFRALCRASRY